MTQTGPGVFQLIEDKKNDILIDKLYVKPKSITQN